MSWFKCDCEEFWCTRHQKHAFECQCPPIEEWEADPYIRRPVMLDLFSGQGGASSAMVERRWDVVTVDNGPEFGCTVTADINQLKWTGDRRVDLIWASPPCTEFSRESMPWCKTGNAPSLDLVKAALRIVEEVKPAWWVLENVRGSVPWLTPILGHPMAKTGPVYMWGNLPPMLIPRVLPYKEKISGKRPDLRSMIPYELSRAVAVAVEKAAKESL